jgi:PfaD family protein
MPEEVRVKLETRILGRSLNDIWADTESFFAERDPHELVKASKSPKHKMALIFRWYLGLSSRWAIAGEQTRKMDYQIWCGPAMGAFNAWSAGSFLGDPGQRTVVQIALNLLEGAAVFTRAHQLRTFGADVPPSAFHFPPRILRLN